MQTLVPFLAFVVGAILGVISVWAFYRGRVTAQTQLVDTFKALAADTLHQNSAAFLQLAEGKLTQKTTAVDDLVKPVKETLQRMDAQIQALELKREGAYRELAEMVTASRETQVQLRNETSQLLQALRAPTARGRWGELQLQRILEMTGMSTHAKDFSTQETFSNDEGNIRPDVIISLPGERCVIIDSKVPLAAYLDSVQSADDSGRQNALKQHARQVKEHIRLLGNKAYWEQVQGTPEFVVLFLPGEHFLSAALDGDADLIEYSANMKVVLATPMTLIALLRTVAYGWRQEALQKNQQLIAETGRKLYSALNLFVGQLATLGNRLGGTVETYNKTINVLEKNVLGKARQLGELGTSTGEEEVPVLEQIERRPRTLTIAGDAAADNTHEDAA